MQGMVCSGGHHINTKIHIFEATIRIPDSSTVRAEQGLCVMNFQYVFNVSADNLVIHAYCRTELSAVDYVHSELFPYHIHKGLLSDCISVLVCKDDTFGNLITQGRYF